VCLDFSAIALAVDGTDLSVFLSVTGLAAVGADAPFATDSFLPDFCASLSTAGVVAIADVAVIFFAGCGGFMPIGTFSDPFVTEPFFTDMLIWGWFESLSTGRALDGADSSDLLFVDSSGFVPAGALFVFSAADGADVTIFFFGGCTGFVLAGGLLVSFAVEPFFTDTPV
jgi:hypothetical protein